MSTCVYVQSGNFSVRTAISEFPRVSLCAHVSGCLGVMMYICCVSRGIGTSTFLDRCVYVFVCHVHVWLSLCCEI